jgi:hypothetical protein
MTKRNSPTDIKSLDDLSRIDEIVVDKRLGKRATEKRNRRNRHYGKQFIKNSLFGGLNLAVADTSEELLSEDLLSEDSLANKPLADDSRIK